MSQDFPNRNKWLAIRHTPHNFHRIRGRLLFTGGTYVRMRGTAEDMRLAWYAQQCNANARGLSRPLRKVAEDGP